MPAPSDPLAALRSALSPASAQTAMRALEDDLTPEQLWALLPEFEKLTGLARMAVGKAITLPELRFSTPQLYRRRNLAPRDAAFFAGEGPLPRDKKMLIIALCGRSNRLMLPWSLFLQHLPGVMFDVVILADRNQDDYVRGVEGYAPDMLSLVRRVYDDVDARGYRKVFTYGTSTGGLPALRFGIMAGAYRSISVGGLISWPIYRLLKGRQIASFDPLCACNANYNRGQLFAVHGDVPRDTIAARNLQRLLPVTRVPLSQTDEHNVIYQVYLAGGLPTFNGRAFDFDVRRLAIRPRPAGGSAETPAASATGD